MKKFVLVILSILSLGLVGGSVAAISVCVSNVKKKEDSSEKIKSPDIFIYEDDDTSNTSSIPEDADLTKFYLGFDEEKGKGVVDAPKYSLGLYYTFNDYDNCYWPVTVASDGVQHYVLSATYDLSSYTFYDCSNFVELVNGDNKDGQDCVRVQLSYRTKVRITNEDLSISWKSVLYKGSFFPTKPGIYVCKSIDLSQSIILLSGEEIHPCLYDFFYCAKESSL